METVEVVVRIPKDVYTRIKKDDYKGKGKQAESDIIDLLSGLDNGTVLPKGHGRLIEADSMKRIDAIQRGDFNSIESIRAWVDIMPTVIEADKEVEND